jgi:hypothetical protein
MRYVDWALLNLVCHSSDRARFLGGGGVVVTKFLWEGVFGRRRNALANLVFRL